MYPEKWRTTTPHVESLFRDTTESVEVRAAVLSALSSLVPTQAASDQEVRQEEEEQTRRVSAMLCSCLPVPLGTRAPPTRSHIHCLTARLTTGQVVTLRDAAAAVVGQLNDPITLVSPLPEELRSLVAYKALPPSAALRLQVQSLSISLS
jgi:hypothetical protein